MYLCIGQDAVVPTRDIVAILDMDNATRAKDTRNFLAAKETAGILSSLGDGIPRSVVLCVDQKIETVYLSPVTAATLSRRSQGLRPDKHPRTDKETKEEL